MARARDVGRLYGRAMDARRGRVRAYVVTMAARGLPGASSSCRSPTTSLSIRAISWMVIDPTDYKIAVSRGEAAVQQNRKPALKIPLGRQEPECGSCPTLPLRQRRKKLSRAMRSLRRPSINRLWANLKQARSQSRAHRDPLAGERLGHSTSWRSSATTPMLPGRTKFSSSRCGFQTDIF